jgi:hypothetical protein
MKAAPMSLGRRHKQQVPGGKALASAAFPPHESQEPHE